MSGKSGPRYPLVEWNVRYCIHQYQAPTRLSWPERVELANQLANEHPATKGPRAKVPEKIVITKKMLLRLEARDDFRALTAALAAGGLQAAQAVLYSQLGQYLDLHHWGAHEAQKRGDIRGLVRYTAPIVEKVLPSKQEVDVQKNVTISIHLSEKRMQEHLAPPTEVTWERLDDGDDEPRKALPSGLPSSVEHEGRIIEPPSPKFVSLEEAIRRRKQTDRPSRDPDA